MRSIVQRAKRSEGERIATDTSQTLGVSIAKASGRVVCVADSPHKSSSLHLSLIHGAFGRIDYGKRSHCSYKKSSSLTGVTTVSPFQSLSVYVVIDSLAYQIVHIATHPNHASAIRSFTDAIGQKGTLLNSHTSDFELWHVCHIQGAVAEPASHLVLSGRQVLDEETRKDNA